MQEVSFEHWNDIQNFDKELNRMNNQLTKYTALLKTRKIKPEQYNNLMKNVTITLYYWTGEMPIGEPKDKIVEKRFQTFFEKLYDFFH